MGRFWGWGLVSLSDSRTANCSGADASRLVTVDVSKRTVRRNVIAHQPLQLLDLGDVARLLAREDERAIDAHLEHAASGVGRQHDGAQLLGEGVHQLLRHPAGPEAPAAQPAVGDLDGRCLRHVGSSLAWRRGCGWRR
jgi:hypothetical protein